MAESSPDRRDDHQPLPKRIWTVEDYYRAKDFYDRRELAFNPPLEEGSPAAAHVIAQWRMRGNLKTDKSDDVEHSTDFRSVLWFGVPYSFTANQAPVVKLLWENWKKRTPDVGDETLLHAVDPEAPPARLANLFRDHPAWGAMISAGKTKGTHRLAGPSNENTKGA